MNGSHEGVPGQKPPHVNPWWFFGPVLRPVLGSGDTDTINFLRGLFDGVAPIGRTSQAGYSVRAPDWAQVRLTPIQKDVYREHITTAQRSIEEVEAYRKANEIAVTGSDVPKPVLRIDEAGFPELVTKAVGVRNPGSTPSAVQAQCWPVALKGKDLVAVIYDGSKGKHLAYLVPAIIHILNQPAVFSGYGPLVLVLTATREAALQIREVADAFITRSGIRTIYLLPGEPREPQLKQLEEDAHICVATPGRLVSFMEESKISLRRCSFLVLDEADQMVTMGFGKQLRTIADNTRPDRQTLVWLSSRTKDANQLIEDLTSDSITVTIGVATHEGDNFEVEHIVCVSETIEKEEKLTALFNDTLSVEGDKAIVFVERKQTVDDLVCNLRLQGWLAVGIHGKKTEQERDYALNALRVGKVSILVATDAAASTLTALKVRLVVSYDYPSSEDEYSRRFMNAARPGGTGVMCTFLAPDETRRAKEVISLLRKAKQNIPPELINVAKNVPRR
ncbi:probable ATP-dependent RNA helicase DDX5 [Rhipicephalus sanguineus]|uniref:probable ATP-dependent RNA helicase DDX5 n=1 Tax=Rhipicephalus sanguineus TaxID=34632 RepID=UPI00189340EE|nr:probable ATP-dependent RNA helicase DDX5 [Rhipicephalus sanguineus]